MDTMLVRERYKVVRVLEVREGASLKGRATVGRLRVAGDRFELPWLRLTGNANDLK